MMINLVSRAEQFVERNRGRRREVAASAGRGAGESGAVQSKVQAGLDARLAQVAPILRGLLAERTGDCDRPYRRVVLQSLTGPGDPGRSGRARARGGLGDPAADHRSPHPHQGAAAVGRLALPHDDAAVLRDATASRRCEHTATTTRPTWTGTPTRCPPGWRPFDSRPAGGPDPRSGRRSAPARTCAESLIARDITEHTLAVKASIWPRDSPLPGTAGGRAVPHGVPDPAARQAGQRGAGRARRCAGRWPLVTGAAGAIGTGICQGLLEAGCLVAATDLPGAASGQLWSQTLERRVPRQDHRGAARRDRPGLGRGGLRRGGADLGRRRSGDPQRRRGHGGFAHRPDARALPQAGAGERGGHAAGAGRGRAAVQAAGAPVGTSSSSRPRTCSAPGAEFRRLQLHQGRGAPAGPHRQPGTGRRRRAGQHGGSRRGVLAAAPAAPGCGPRSVPTG